MVADLIHVPFLRFEGVLVRQADLHLFLQRVPDHATLIIFIHFYFTDGWHTWFSKQILNPIILAFELYHRALLVIVCRFHDIHLDLILGGIMVISVENAWTVASAQHQVNDR